MNNFFGKPDLTRIKRIILIFLGSVFCFVVGTILSAFLLWHFFEFIHIHDVSGSAPDNFPVLVKSVDGNDTFRICNYSDLSSEFKTVDSFDDKSIASINRDLSRKDESSFGCIKVIRKKKDYTDVCLEVHPDWRKGWYRVQNGKILPQKLLVYSRGMAYGLTGCPGIGVICAIIFLVIMILIKSKKNAQPGIK